MYTDIVNKKKLHKAEGQGHAMYFNQHIYWSYPQEHRDITLNSCKIYGHRDQILRLKFKCTKITTHAIMIASSHIVEFGMWKIIINMQPMERGGGRWGTGPPPGPCGAEGRRGAGGGRRGTGPTPL